LFQLASGDVISDFITGTLSSTFSQLNSLLSSTKATALLVNQQLVAVVSAAIQNITTLIQASSNTTQQYVNSASLNASSPAVQACLAQQAQNLSSLNGSASK